jgi:hypothetical protein
MLGHATLDEHAKLTSLMDKEHGHAANRHVAWANGMNMLHR